MMTLSNLNNHSKQDQSYYLKKIADQKLQAGFSEPIKGVVLPMFSCSPKAEVAMRYFFDMVDPDDTSAGFTYLRTMFMEDTGVSKRTASRRFNELIDEGLIRRHLGYDRKKNRRNNEFWLTEKSLRIYHQVPEITYSANSGPSVQSTSTSNAEFEELLRDALSETDALMKGLDSEEQTLAWIRSASKISPVEQESQEEKEITRKRKVRA